MTTLEQVRKAYEDLSDDDKKSFHQSISDRVHESIAAQERADGNEDSQSAAAREYEALGAEHAAEHGDVAELHEENKREEKQERREDRQDERENEGRAEAEAWRKSVEERFDKLEATLSELTNSKSKLDASREKYGLSAIPSGDNGRKEYTDEDIKKLLA